MLTSVTKNMSGVMQASGWEHKCLIAQEALTAVQAEAARLQRQEAASAAAAHSQRKLLEQLQAAETALAASHGSAQKLLGELNESRATRKRTQQQLEGTDQRTALSDYLGFLDACLESFGTKKGQVIQALLQCM